MAQNFPGGWLVIRNRHRAHGTLLKWLNIPKESLHGGIELWLSTGQPRSQLCGCGPIGVWEDLGLPAAPASAPCLVCRSGGYDVEADRLGAKGCPKEGPGDPSDWGMTHYGYWPVDGIRCQYGIIG